MGALKLKAAEKELWQDQPTVETTERKRPAVLPTDLAFNVDCDLQCVTGAADATPIRAKEEVEPKLAPEKVTEAEEEMGMLATLRDDTTPMSTDSAELQLETNMAVRATAIQLTLSRKPEVLRAAKAVAEIHLVDGKTVARPRRTAIVARKEESKKPAIVMDTAPEEGAFTPTIAEGKNVSKERMKE